MIQVCCLKNVWEKPMFMLWYGHKVFSLTHLFSLLISFYRKTNVNMECLFLANRVSTKEHKGWLALLTDFLPIFRLTIGEPGK